jgi:signal transduction histidine kinase
MVEETDRLIRLTNDLLVLARSDAGRSLRHEPVPIAPLVDDVCRQANVLAEQRTIVCETVPNVRAMGDQDAIKQVLLILLDNALKYTPTGGTITIGAEQTDRMVKVRIADTGPGVAPDDLPHIFKRFYRSDESRTGSGAGLGLAIAQELIEEQHGEITVQSEIGKGTTFTVTLPLA